MSTAHAVSQTTFAASHASEHASANATTRLVEAASFFNLVDFPRLKSKSLYFRCCCRTATADGDKMAPVERPDEIVTVEVEIIRSRRTIAQVTTALTPPLKTSSRV
jgi:hypothetical protein